MTATGFLADCGGDRPVGRGHQETARFPGALSTPPPATPSVSLICVGTLGAVAMCVGIDGAVSSRDEDAGSGSQVNRPVSKVLV